MESGWHNYARQQYCFNLYESLSVVRDAGVASAICLQRGTGGSLVEPAIARRSLGAPTRRRKLGRHVAVLSRRQSSGIRNELGASERPLERARLTCWTCVALRWRLRRVFLSILSPIRRHSRDRRRTRRAIQVSPHQMTATAGSSWFGGRDRRWGGPGRG